MRTGGDQSAWAGRAKIHKIAMTTEMTDLFMFSTFTTLKKEQVDSLRIWGTLDHAEHLRTSTKEAPDVPSTIFNLIGHNIPRSQRKALMNPYLLLVNDIDGDFLVELLL
jgi:hypothetical protein